MEATRTSRRLDPVDKAARDKIVKRVLGQDRLNPAPPVDVAAFSSSI